MSFYTPSQASRQSLLNPYRPSTGFPIVKMYIPNIYKFSTDSVVVQMHTTILLRHSMGFTVVKTCITIHYGHSTGFAVVKTGLLNLYRLSTGIAAVKTGMTILYRLSTILPVLCKGSAVGFLNNYRPSTSFEDKLSTAFVVFRTDLQNQYRYSTNFAVNKTVLTITYRASTTFPVVKRAQQIYTVLQWAFGSQKYLAKLVMLKLCGSQSGFVEPLQVFNWLGYFHHHLEVHSLCMPATFFSSCCSSNILPDICIMKAS